MVYFRFLEVMYFVLNVPVLGYLMQFNIMEF